MKEKIIKLISLVIIIPLILSGCSFYKNYPFDYYERKGSNYSVEFHMKDSTVYPVEKMDISLIKNSKEYYTLYFKNMEPLVLKKDQIASVKMRNVETYTKVIVITSVAFGGLVILGTIFIIKGFADVFSYWSSL